MVEDDSFSMELVTDLLEVAGLEGTPGRNRDWALEILGPPATQQLALGTVVSAAIQAMRMRSPDLAVDIGELHGDWKDEKIFGKKFLRPKNHHRKQNTIETFL